MRLRLAAILVLFSLGLFYGLGIHLVAVEPARISIPELLNPETRLRTFYKYIQLPERAGTAAERFEDFALVHPSLEVTGLRKNGEPSGYIVTWDLPTAFEGWEPATATRDGNTALPPTITPRKCFGYRFFAPDGTELAQANYERNGTIADLNRDGDPEILELRDAGDEGMIAQYVVVRPPGPVTAPSIAILFNAHRAEHAVANTWDFRAVDPDRDGVYEIHLGPLFSRGGADLRVIFRWDKAARAWIGPDPKPGDHFRVLRGPGFDQEARKIAEHGGIGYPLISRPKRPRSGPTPPAFMTRIEDYPLERLAKPYRYESLTHLSHKELFTYMSARRSIDEYPRDAIEAFTRVPEFWTLDPADAALAYAERNRPDQLSSIYLLGISIPRTEAAPAVGDLTLSDGPSGCFAPEGSYIHHLHCAPEGSFFLYGESFRPYFNIPHTERQSRFQFKKLEIPYALARHILQTAWWLAHIRSRNIDGHMGSGNFVTSSTSDGSATVHIAAGNRSLSVSGTRSALELASYAGVGDMDDSYDESAFIKLVVKLLRHEVPARLGDPWKALAVPSPWRGHDHTPTPHTADELRRGEREAADLLRLFQKGHASPEIAIEVVALAGEMGWRSLRAQIEDLSNTLPPLFEYEKELAAIDRELQSWQEKSGREASEAAYRDRTFRKQALNRDGSALGILDQALLELLRRKPGTQENLPEQLAARASYRLGSKAWEPLQERAQSEYPYEGITREQALSALTFLAETDPAEYLPKMRELLGAKLRDGDGSIDVALWSIWQLDLREFKKDIERIATNSPDDYEWTGLRNARKGAARTIRHRARHIAALWNEENSFTRARLLIAFATTHAWAFTQPDEPVTKRLLDQLASATRNLDKDQLRSLADFASWCNEEARVELGEYLDQSRLEAVRAILANALKGSF